MKRPEMRHFLRAGLALLALCSGHALSATELYWTESRPSPRPFVAGPSFIVTAHADGSGATDLLSVSSPNGIESYGGTLYWPDQGANAIGAVSPDGSNAQLFTASNVYDVAVSGSTVYWPLLNSNVIQVGGVTAGNLTVASSITVARPIAVDVDASHLYWSEFDTRRIVRANLDGSNAVTLATLPGFGAARDIEVFGNALYYVTDTGDIGRMNLDGTARTTLAATGSFLNGLDVTANAIYVSSLFGAIERTNLDGSNLTLLYSRNDGTQIRGIVAVDIAPVPEPETWALLACGLGLVGLASRKRGT